MPPITGPDDPFNSFPAPSWATPLDFGLVAPTANDLPLSAMDEPEELARILEWAVQGKNDAEGVHQPDGTTQREDASLPIKLELQKAAEEAQRRNVLLAASSMSLDPVSRVELNIGSMVISLTTRKLAAEARGDFTSAATIGAVIEILENIETSLKENQKEIQKAEQKGNEENQQQARRSEARRQVKEQVERKIEIKNADEERQVDRSYERNTFQNWTTTVYFNELAPRSARLVDEVRDRRLADEERSQGPRKPNA